MCLCEQGEGLKCQLHTQSTANAAVAAGSGNGNSLEVLAGYLLQLRIRCQPYGTLGTLVGVLHEQPHPGEGDHPNANGRH